MAINGCLKVDLSTYWKPNGNKWVFKVNHDADVSTERYEKRFVEKGYNQIEGLNFFDTFSQGPKSP